MPGTFPTCNEHDVSLTDSNVIALQKEEFVDAIILKGCDLDDGSDRTGEALLDDQVFLALNLDTITCRVSKACL